MKAPSDSAPPQPSTSVPREQPQTAEVPALRIDWKGWLETVRALPLEAPDWEGIPQFLETLSQLYQNNQQERQAHRRNLREALDALTTQSKGRLAYFEMQDASQWTAETCLSTHLTEAAQLSEQLLILLLQHYENGQQQPATREEERSRRQVVDKLADEIDGVYGQLAKLFAISPEGPSQHQDEEEHLVEAEPPSTPSEPHSETPDDPSPQSQPGEFLPQEDQALSSRTESESVDSRTNDFKPSTVPESAPSASTPPIPKPLSRPEPPPDQAAQEPIVSEQERPQLAQEEHSEEDDKTASALPQAVESRTKEVLPQDSSPFDLDPEQSPQREASDPPAFVPPEVSDSDILLPGGRNSDIQKIAFHLQTTSDPKEWTNLLWALIAEDALPTAYWLARALPAMNQPCPVPDWLLASVQATRWFAPDSQPFVFDLTNIVQNSQPFQDEPQKLLGLSAALRATLLVPSTGIQTWLSVPQSCPNLVRIVDAVKIFANWGRSLQPADLRGVADAEQRKESLREATQKAKAWLEEASKRRTTLKRASNVWLHMTAPEGAIRNFLLPVVEDEQKKLSTVRENLQQWQDRDYITSRIDEIDKELAGKKARRIDGDIRNRIVRDVQNACDLARRWCECVEREQEIQSGTDSFSQMVNEVRSQIQEALPEAIQTLRDLSGPSLPQDINAAAQCLLRSVEQLQDMFAEQPSHRQQDWFAGADSLSTALGRLLLWLPEILQEDTRQIAESALSQVAPALCQAIAEGRSLQSAFDTWLTIHDYRFMDPILAAFDEAELHANHQAYQDAWEGSRAGLQIAKSKTQAAIERAEVDGIISVEKRSEYDALVEGLKPEETRYFPPKLEQLTQIKTQLEAAREARLRKVQIHWGDLLQKLPTEIAPETWEHMGTTICGFVQQNLAKRETRVVEECIAHLAQVAEGTSRLEESLFSLPPSRDALREFLDARPRLQRELSVNLRAVARDIKVRGATIANINFSEVPQNRRDEADKAISAWQALKQGGATGTSIPGSVTALLRYLDFRVGSEEDVCITHRQANWVYIQAKMSAGYLAKPIPQFGSQTGEVYSIVCVWQRLDATETLDAWLRTLHDAHNNDVHLVFYLGRLEKEKWLSFAHRAPNPTFALLDEILLVLLAQEERNTRLPIFLQCTLPFSVINPYVLSGAVPPEMFFGRDPMVRALQDPSSKCLVYGGRQLGKSALLQHVYRTFHDSKQEQYAWVEDIKALGDTRAGLLPGLLWEKVRDILKKLELLPDVTSTNDPDRIQKLVREAMDAKPQRRVLMLFDEADHFLRADAKDRFKVVGELRKLMDDTNDRFKVVFTGLQHVQRFESDPNQPLGKFGPPLLVGPLEPSAAQQLVCEPLEVLGYRFEDAGTVLRILSYTNYHPGLIQIFCHELLNHLRSRQHKRQFPPYPIIQRDVDNVYRLSEVRERIRERFAWTLALDSCYQAIVWTMILDQINSQDGYAKSYELTELGELAEEYWPKGFERIKQDQFRALLKEMIGLGVLVQSAYGHYRLRSPNLVHLIGTETDIEALLAELSDKEPEEPFHADSYHVLLDGQLYSPLTHIQENFLKNPESPGVGLVFASDSLGLSHIEAAFQRFIPADLPANKGSCQEIPPEALSSTMLVPWLSEYLDAHKASEQLILWGSFRETNTHLLETVKAAHREIGRLRTRWVRLLFVFNPGATWNWLSLPPLGHKDIEKQVDVVISPRRWDFSGIHQRLIQQNKMASKDKCRAVLETTGGWPWLLDDLLGRVEADDPGPATQILEQALRDPASQLSREFTSSLGLHATAWRLLKFIKTLEENGQEVPIEFIAEDVDGSPPLSPEEREATIEYLQRMGCVDLRDDLLSVEPTILRIL